MTAFTQYLNVSFTTEKCWVCGVHFALERDYSAKRGKDGKQFHCPNGCKLAFGPSEVQELKDKLARERARHDQTEARLRDERQSHEHTGRQLIAQRGATTRIKRRIGKGVCPCCNRTFADLTRHMNTKHPNYAGSDG